MGDVCPLGYQSETLFRKPNYLVKFKKRGVLPESPEGMRAFLVTFLAEEMPQAGVCSK